MGAGRGDKAHTGPLGGRGRQGLEGRARWESETVGPLPPATLDSEGEERGLGFLGCCREGLTRGPRGMTAHEGLGGAEAHTAP